MDDYIGVSYASSDELSIVSEKMEDNSKLELSKEDDLKESLLEESKASPDQSVSHNIF